MSTASKKNAIMLPNEMERRHIFYWLKQVSSWTAWHRIFGYYQAWADVTEASVREASERGWLMHYDADNQPIGGVLQPDSEGDMERTGSGIPESDYRSIVMTQ